MHWEWPYTRTIAVMDWFRAPISLTLSLSLLLLIRCVYTVVYVSHQVTTVGVALIPWCVGLRIGNLFTELQTLTVELRVTVAELETSKEKLQVIFSCVLSAVLVCHTHTHSL